MKNGGPPPSLDEVALGGLLEDIGKFMQRAHAREALPEAVRNRESVLLPTAPHGRYSHHHVLWTEAFFHWMEENGISFPSGLNRDRVRDQAVFHHRPDRPLTWLSAEADRLSAGMDRKARDEQDEAAPKGPDAFRRTALQPIFARIELGLGATPRPHAYRIEALEPENMFPAEAAPNDLPAAYARLWKSFSADFERLCGTVEDIDLFHEGILSLSERYTWCIPSSTIDQPDISLHDHNRTVAAIAACLYRHHEAFGDLDDQTAICNRQRPKFHFLIGDLSGIQSSLFRLANEQVRGVNRILRARSFLMGEIVEAAALLCRRHFRLPPYCLLQQAGGRFLLLLPVLPEGRIEGDIARLKASIETWMRARYFGDLALNLALSPAFGGEGLMRARFAETWRAATLAVEAAKLTPFGSAPTGVIKADYAAGPEGRCAACGLRPATMTEHREGGETIRRCRACHDEHELGGDLRQATAVLLKNAAQDPNALGLLDRFGLRVIKQEGASPRPDLRRAVVSGWRLRNKEGLAFPPASRFLANCVPVLREGDGADGRYAHLSEEAREKTVGDAKTFEHLAADALERGANGGFLGREMLAVVKADVDRLGAVFGHGLGPDRTLGRQAALSRMLDAFFTGYLTHLLETEFRNVYTVYSGGDDLLLIAPWYDGIRLAARLRAEFGRFVQHNPNLTLSAGIELISPKEPINRAVWRAEERLEAAKHAGRDRVSLIDDPRKTLAWRGAPDSLEWALAQADWLSDQIRQRVLSTSFLYKLLRFDDDRRRTEQGDMRAANWRARLGYHLAREEGIRAIGKRSIAEHDDLIRRLCALSGLPLAPGAASERSGRIAIAIALHRNR